MYAVSSPHGYTPPANSQTVQLRNHHPSEGLCQVGASPPVAKTDSRMNENGGIIFILIRVILKVFYREKDREQK